MDLLFQAMIPLGGHLSQRHAGLCRLRHADRLEVEMSAVCSPRYRLAAVSNVSSVPKDSDPAGDDGSRCWQDRLG